MYVTHKAYNHGEWKNHNNERKECGKATTQSRDKTDKAGSASSEGAPTKSVSAYTKEDQIELEAALEAVLLTSNLPPITMGVNHGPVTGKLGGPEYDGLNDSWRFYILLLVFGALLLAQFLPDIFYLLLPSMLHYWILDICFNVQLFYGACLGLTCVPLDYWKLGRPPSLQPAHDVLTNLLKFSRKCTP